MLRKLLIAAAIAIAAAATVPTDASARGGRHGGGGGWHGGGGHWHGGGGRWHGGYRGWYGPGFYGLYTAPYYAYNNYGCWRTVRVGTRYGWRWRRVWVCG